MTDTLAARARRLGLRPQLLQQRKKRGWAEHDLETPPLPANHSVNKARPTKRTHPWRVWMPGRYSRADAVERGQ